MTSSHHPPNKPHERFNIPLHARLLQRRLVLFPPLYGDQHPWVAGGHGPTVRHETSKATVAVAIRMDLDEEEMP